MGPKKARKKRKQSDRSDSSMEKAHESKAGKMSDSPTVQNATDNNNISLEVSQILNDANSVLFNVEEELEINVPVKNSFSALSSTSPSPSTNNKTMEKVSPTHPVHTVSTSTPVIAARDKNARNNDGKDINTLIVESLHRIESRLGNVEKRLDTLESLDKKVDNFEKEVSKVWSYVIDLSKKGDIRYNELRDKAESTEFSLGLANDKVLELEKEKDKMKEEMLYIQSQSMRNNLLFANIEEAPQGSPETQVDSEYKIRDFLENKMKLAKSVVDSINFERVHRIGQRSNGKVRNIVAKFCLFKDREMVRKQRKELELGGTDYGVFEQFTFEIVEKRRPLITKMKQARNEDKMSWMSYDTLYIDGKPVKSAKG